MSRGKSADRSGCSLVAEAVIIAGNHCLTDQGRCDLWGHESEAMEVVTAECFMRGDPAQGPQKPDFAPCAVPGTVPLRVILMMQVLSADAMYP